MNNRLLVSVILPVRNESAFINNSLGAVCVQDYAAELMEILIADGISTDETRKIVHNVAALHPQLQIHILDNPGKIVPTGINMALRESRQASRKQ